MKFMSGIVIPVLPVRNSDDYLPSSTTLQMISNVSHNWSTYVRLGNVLM